MALSLSEKLRRVEVCTTPTPCIGEGIVSRRWAVTLARKEDVPEPPPLPWPRCCAARARSFFVSRSPIEVRGRPAADALRRQMDTAAMQITIDATLMPAMVPGERAESSLPGLLEKATSRSAGLVALNEGKGEGGDVGARLTWGSVGRRVGRGVGDGVGGDEGRGVGLRVGARVCRDVGGAVGIVGVRTGVGCGDGPAVLVAVGGGEGAGVESVVPGVGVAVGSEDGADGAGVESVVPDVGFAVVGSGEGESCCAWAQWRSNSARNIHARSWSILAKRCICSRHLQSNAQCRRVDRGQRAHRASRPRPRVTAPREQPFRRLVPRAPWLSVRVRGARGSYGLVVWSRWKRAP